TSSTSHRPDQLERHARFDGVALLDRLAAAVVVLPLAEADGRAVARVEDAEADAVVLDAGADVLGSAAEDAYAGAAASSIVVGFDERRERDRALGAAEVVATQ